MNAKQMVRNAWLAALVIIAGYAVVFVAIWAGS